jgi:prepilin-type N-terminal cleavage/methylation domain-containing protein
VCPKEIRRLLRQRSIVAPCFRVVGRLKGSETGVTLIETLVALALIGIISVAFLSGLATAAKATFIADEQATAESLARSQIEYVKNQGYDSEATTYLTVDAPEGYAVSVDVSSIPDPDTDTGIQKIRVTVKRGAKTVLIIDAYKVDR